MQAVALYERGYARNLVFSSGFIFSLREAEAATVIAHQEMIFAEALIPPSDSRDQPFLLEVTPRQ